MKEAIHEQLRRRMLRLEKIIIEMDKFEDHSARVCFLQQLPEVTGFWNAIPWLHHFILTLPIEEQLIALSIIAFDQGHAVFSHFDKQQAPRESIRNLLQQLIPIQHFYDSLGGLLGYCQAILKLLLHWEKSVVEEGTEYLEPRGFDIAQVTADVRKAIRSGFEHLPELAEVYPVGGAGDRLSLKDEKTGESLPAAYLLYGGRTLLEGLFRDLQAREYCYYKLFDKQITTPVALMTSDDKNNDEQIRNICQQLWWFGRPIGSFRFFVQPLVPVVTEEGEFAISPDLKLILKPGGHGVLWKLLHDSGVIDVFLHEGRKKVLIRQINNPISGVDYGLVAFAGIGFLNQKLFGFASCPRLLNTAEGMDILVETIRKDRKYAYRITNVEYTDFAKHNIKDFPAKPGGSFSAFPANTNILFADLAAVKEILQSYPIPGLMINMKTTVNCLDRKGHHKHVAAGRLESLMQNLADGLVDEFEGPQEVSVAKKLKTFLTYNSRRKTISVTKKSYSQGNALTETPEGCFYDHLQNARDLFVNFCHFKMPEVPAEEQYQLNAPPFVIDYHPALGPLYSIICQKIQGGEINQGSELSLEIAEITINDLSLNGSLRVEAQDILGHRDENSAIKYSDRCGKCILRNVKIKNRGIDFSAANSFWKSQITRHEELFIEIEGNGEFIAENVVFEGGFHFIVPEGNRMRCFLRDGKVETVLEEIKEPSWKWKYQFNTDDDIQLTKISSQ